MDGKITVLGIKVNNRKASALQLQKVFTNFGCTIKTRLGLHDLDNDHDSCDGCALIILELIGIEEECLRLELELKSIDGVIVKKMEF